MRVLIATASKHGATSEIGDTIAEVLGNQGFDVTTKTPEEVGSVDTFDAVILGSAVYAGRWMRPARELVDRLAPDLAQGPVWLFSSGPLGTPPEPGWDPVDVAEIKDVTAARSHRLFMGKLDWSTLDFAEKAIAAALQSPSGDFRDWDAVTEWAREIGERLETEISTPPIPSIPY
jgi:menaquinone-dependent protoporphyrinogen oxidase